MGKVPREVGEDTGYNTGRRDWPWRGGRPVFYDERRGGRNKTREARWGKFIHVEMEIGSGRRNWEISCMMASIFLMKEQLIPHQPGVL